MFGRAARLAWGCQPESFSDQRFRAGTPACIAAGTPPEPSSWKCRPYVALSRLDAQQPRPRRHRRNIANCDTPGFKASRTLFSDWLAGRVGPSRRGGRVVAYTQDRATYRERSGPLTHTANPFDLAISRHGFFTVNTAQGPRLTRAGRFDRSRTARSAMRTATRCWTRPASRSLSPADTRSIAGDGTISSENGQIGRIGVVQPSRREPAAGLRATG